MRKLLYGALLLLGAHPAWAKQTIEKTLEFETDLATSMVRFYTSTPMGKNEWVEVILADNPKMDNPIRHFVMQTPEHVEELDPGLYYLRYRFTVNKRNLKSSKPIEIHLEKATRVGWTPPAPPETPPFDWKAFWNQIDSRMYFGAGGGMVGYRQRNPALAGLDYQDFRAPVIALGSEHQLFPRWQAAFDLRMGQNGFTSLEPVIAAQKYIWKTLGAQAVYLASEPGGASALSYGLKGGLVYQELPFWHIDLFGSQFFKYNKLYMLRAGVWGKVAFGDFSLGAELGYQYPMYEDAPGDENMEVHNPQFYDATFSIEYVVSERWKIGLFNVNQLQRFNFNYKDGIDSSRGKMDTFFTNVDLRLGYDF